MCGSSKHLSFNQRVIEGLILRIDEDIKEDLSIDYLSKVIGYSPGHLSRLFKAKVGITLAAYIRMRKIEFAAIEINLGSRFIVDISTDYSFSSQSSFCRAFKSVVGVPPKEYRDYINT